MPNCIAQNSVVIANQVNPSIFTQLWLVNKGILKETDFKPGCIFSSQFVQIQAEDFDMLVLPDRIQLTPNVAELKQQASLVDGIVGKIVELLPHTPYSAVGINFTWRVAISEADFAAVNRRILCGNSPLSDEFSEPDARFGAYFSKNVFDARLRLDIKPTKGDEGESMSLGFNFNRDLSPDNEVAEIKQLLGKWVEAYQLCERMSKKIEGAACDQ